MLIDWLRIPTDRRMGALFEAFRRGYSIEDVRDVSGGVTRWFLHRFEKMAALETEIRAAGELGMSASEIPMPQRCADGRVQDLQIYTSLIHSLASQQVASNHYRKILMRMQLGGGGTN